VRMPIVSPQKFAAWFNRSVPGAYRQITVEDAQLMSQCGLIGRCQYYGQSDFRTVIGILRYEQLREKRINKLEAQLIFDVPRCKRCGEPLPPQPEDKKGRPREYCSECESSRSKDRYHKWRRKKQAVLC
jgi:hypothetical protein